MSACMVRIFFPFFEPLALASTHSSRSFTLESKHSSASQMLSRSSFSRSFRAASTRIASSRSLLLMSPRKLRNRSVGPPANPPPSTISWDISIAGAGALAWPTTLAGAPATIACGATGLSTNDPAAINDRKQALVRQIGAECREHGVSFLFEPIVYDRGIEDGASAEFAGIKPELVERATRSFAAPEFNIDILKVELPVNLNHVEGIGENRMSRAEAEAVFRRAAEAAGDVPLLYLSAGVTFEQFEAGLQLARAAGVDVAGFMCGRAIWSDAIDVFGAEGPEAAEAWMADEGLRRLRKLGEALA